MKNQAYLTLSLTFLGSISSSFAQSGKEVRNRIEGTDRPSVPSLATGAQSGNENTSAEATSSDTGAQRPIQLKKKGVSSYFGYDSKYFYRSNPLATDGPLKQQATGMWTNTFFAGAGLGVFDAENSVITPYIGASWTINDYIEGGLDKFNYNSTGAYALLLAQFGNGWSVRAGVSYSSDSSSENDTEDYKEYHPNIGVLKSYSVNESTTAIFDASIGMHSAESFVITGLTDGSKTASEKELSNIEYAASYALNYNVWNLVVTPKYRISYRAYDEGLNDGRDDLSHDASLKIDYPIADSLKLSFFYSYSKRNSDGTTLNYDYKSYDAGFGLGLNARF